MAKRKKIDVLDAIHIAIVLTLVLTLAAGYKVFTGDIQCASAAASP